MARNNIANNDIGIDLSSSSNNSISGNNIADNGYGIHLNSSSDNNVYHNNFVENTHQVQSAGSINVWDDGYTSGGNYWSNYNGTDTNQDGIGDTPYTITANNADGCPLMGSFQSFNITVPPQNSREVYVISNVIISDIRLYAWLTTPNEYLNAGQLFLALIPPYGESTGTGFCRMILANNILNTSNYTVLIDLTPINYTRLPISNETYTILYFTFNPSAQDDIFIVPEFSLLMVPALMMTTATLLTLMVLKRKLSTKQRILA
jgi:parallel beta-helix repeat protein